MPKHRHAILCLSICLSACLTACLSAYVSVCLSVSLLTGDIRRLFTHNWESSSEVCQ